MTPNLPPDASTNPPLMPLATMPNAAQVDRGKAPSIPALMAAPIAISLPVATNVDWMDEENMVILATSFVDGLAGVAYPEQNIDPHFSSDAGLLSVAEVRQAETQAIALPDQVPQDHTGLTLNDRPATLMISTVAVNIYQTEKLSTGDGEQEPGRISVESIQPELRIKPGEDLDEAVLRQDLQQLQHLGLFSDAATIVTNTNEGQQVRYELVENPPIQFGFSGGTDQFIGTFGSVSYRNQEIGTLGQRLDLALQASTTGDVQFHSNFFNPYLVSQPDRPGYRISWFRDRMQAGRIGAGMALYRPLGDWQASLGLDYARITIQDQDGQGRPLSFSGTNQDDLVTLSLGLILDRRNNPFRPNHGWILSLGTEQSLPIGLGNVFSTRLKATLTQHISLKPVSTHWFAETLVFRAEAATILGDLRPYRSLRVNDPNFIRLDNIRSYLLASAEYRFPMGSLSIFDGSVPIGGAIFLDLATDLGSGDTVPGRSSTNLGGGGLGYGIGLRARSSLGLLRLDVGFTNQGELQVQAGLGQRF